MATNCNGTDNYFPMLVDIYFPIINQTQYGQPVKNWVFDRSVACNLEVYGRKGSPEITPEAYMKMKNTLKCCHPISEKPLFLAYLMSSICPMVSFMRWVRTSRWLSRAKASIFGFVWCWYRYWWQRLVTSPSAPWFNACFIAKTDTSSRYCSPLV